MTAHCEIQKFVAMHAVGSKNVSRYVNDDHKRNQRQNNARAELFSTR